MNRLQRLCILGLIAGLAAGPAVAAKPKPKPKPPAPTGDAALIRSAMSAAPRKVAEAATIVVAGKDGAMRTLRAGSGPFTCMPDNPVTPGPDPMCMDAAAMAWAHAWMSHGIPATGRVGLVYMLEGGTDASNTDPYATAPTSTNAWVKTGPHVMVVGADANFYAMYPQAASPDTAVPYVMWPDTPYQHLMIPVK